MHEQNEQPHMMICDCGLLFMFGWEEVEADYEDDELVNGTLTYPRCGHIMLVKVWKKDRED